MLRATRRGLGPLDRQLGHASLEHQADVTAFDVGKRQQAQEHLRTATTMYRDMDIRFWREQAEAELAERH